MALIRSISGIRGVAGTDMTEAIARRYGVAFAVLARGDVAVGFDSRRGGEALKDAVCAGLAEGGARPLDAGVVATPTLGIAVRRRGLAGAVAVTASHNPEEWNGLKFFSARGVFLDAAALARLLDLADRQGEAKPKPSGAPGRISGAVDDHVALVAAATAIDVSAIAAASPKVVVECVNAAGSVLLPRLLRRLGARVVELWTSPGSGFPRSPEPLPEHLGALSRAVEECAADVGLACDPDADRLAVVDERGRPIGEEYTLPIASLMVLRGSRGPIVTNVSTSMMLDDVARDAGVSLYRTAVGEANVVAKMEEVSAVLGGEGNGGVILPDVHPGRDAGSAAALVLSALCDQGGTTMSEIVLRFRPTAMVKHKVAVGQGTPSGIVDAMRSRFPDAELDLTDGAKLSWPDRWVHARMSGTEPFVRVIAEAERHDDAEELARSAIAVLSRGAGGS